jgi:hypothetical protein
MRHFPLRELGHGIGLLVLLAATYVGAYFATMKREPIWRPNLGLWAEAGFQPRPEFRAFYGEGDDFLQPLFEPIHAIDRRLRPEFWK